MNVVEKVILVSAAFVLAQGAVVKRYGNLPLVFEPNRGQTNSQAQFLARAGGYDVFITADKAVLRMGASSVGIRLNGGRKSAKPEAVEPLTSFSNYILGNDPSRWLQGVQHFAKVRVASVLPGVDLTYYGEGRELEYDLDVAPGVDTSKLAVQFDGAQGLSLDAEGNLLVHTVAGDIVQHKPQASQGQKSIATEYALLPDGAVAIRLGQYNHKQALKIDPVLSYSTYLSGSGIDVATAIAVDSSGNAFVTGSTTSVDFPVTSGSAQGGGDVFLTKLNPGGTNVLYSTYLGGSGVDQANAIAIDTLGNAYIAGFTSSNNFPGAGSLIGGTQNSFVSKISAAGMLLYSKLLGGVGSGYQDAGNGIALDSSGAIYVTGNTDSSAFPTTAGSFQSSRLMGSTSFLYTGYVAKLSAAGAVVYATYLGGSYFDSANAIAVDKQGNAYIAGEAVSQDFPSTRGAFQSTKPSSFGTSSAFLTELNAAGSAAVFSTFIGGSQGGYAVAVQLDSAGNMYVAGTEYSTPSFSQDFPTTPGAYISTSAYLFGGGFITKVNPGGATLAYSSLLTGAGYGKGLALDSKGSAYFLSFGVVLDFPVTPGALEQLASNTLDNLLVLQLSPGGDTLVYATILGDGSFSSGGIALDQFGGVYVAGGTSSQEFPVTPSAFQTQFKMPSTSHAFVSRIDFSSPTLCNFNLSSNSLSPPALGATGKFTFTGQAACPWQVVVNNGASPSPFITVNPGTSLSGVGSGSVSYTVGPNLDTGLQTRTGTITVNGGTLVPGSTVFTVSQPAASCSEPVFNTSQLSFGTTGGSGSVGVVLNQGCWWAMSAPPPWITLQPPVPYIGSGTLSLSVAPNRFSTRQASITVATKSITVTQAGGPCALNLLSPGASFAATGGTGAVSFTTGALGITCNWSAYPLVSWIQVPSSGSSGQGSGTMPFVVAANPTAAPRSGGILIGDQVFQVTQAAGPVSGALSLSPYTGSVFAGNGAESFSGDGGLASVATLHAVSAVAFDTQGNAYIADSGNNRIRKVDTNGIITTFAGGGTAGLGDGGPPTAATLNNPQGVAVDSSGIVYIADTGNQRIRKVANNVISTYAGTGTAGFNGDNQLAVLAALNSPTGIAVDRTGNLYIADTNNNKIRKVTLDGNIATIAPTGSASLNSPRGVALDSAGDVFIADSMNNRILKLLPNGTIIAAAGNGQSDQLGTDGILATSSGLFQPLAVVVDGEGSVYIADYSRIRKVTTDGIIHTIAADAFYNLTGNPRGLALDAANNLYIANSSNVSRYSPSPAFCGYSVSLPAAVSSAGGSVTVQVATAAGCSWSAGSSPVWATLSGAGTATGSGSVTLNVSANTGNGPRHAAVTVAGQDVIVAQGGPTSPAPATVTYDVDANGKQDVLVYYPGLTGYQYSLLSAGTGSYTSIASSGVNSGSATFDTVLQADFNGDSKSDVLFYSSATGVLKVGLGNGSGTYAYAPVITITPGYNFIARGDFNGDGKTDLLLYRQSDGAAAIGLSNGDGTFTFIPQTFSPGFTSVAVGDYNGDGISDVIVYNNQTSPYNAYLLSGDGTGHFTGSSLFFGGGYTVYPADLNADGKTDFVLYRPSDGTVFIAISNGTSFTYKYQLYSPGFTAFKIGDVNGDGFPDFVLYNSVNAIGYLLLGDGAGNFTAASSLFFGPGMDFVDLRDVNGDGKQDVILYRSTTGTSFTGISAGTNFTYTYNYFGPGRIVAQ